MRFTYDGFQQDGDVRHFLFHASEGTSSRALSILIDLGLMVRNRLSLQDGPMLCLRLLNKEAPHTPDSLERFTSYTVVPDDFQSIVFERQQKQLERLSRKIPRKPLQRPPTSSGLHL